MGDKKQKKTKKQRRNARSKRETSKRGQLPSSVQALLGYLGPTPMYQQPVSSLQKERAGVDSNETLSQIIRQQNLMNVSYMQNMEKLAFKNEMQEQLKKQGEKNQEEIKQQSQEQKKEQVKANQALQETAEISIQQQRVSLMRKLAYETKHKNRSEKIQSLQEQIEILEGSIRNTKVSDLRTSLAQAAPNLAKKSDIPSTPYVPPSWLTGSPALASLRQSPALSVHSFRHGGNFTPNLVLQQQPTFQVDAAPVDVLPAIDRNTRESYTLNTQLQTEMSGMFGMIESHIAQVKEGRKTLTSEQELKRNIAQFGFADASSSSGVAGKWQSSLKITRTKKKYRSIWIC
jgi:hypothetical protein